MENAHKEQCNQIVTNMLQLKNISITASSLKYRDSQYQHHWATMKKANSILSTTSFSSITTLVILWYLHRCHFLNLWVILINCLNNESRKITCGTQLSRTIHISRSVSSIFFGKNMQLWGCWSTCSGKRIHLEDAPHGGRIQTINVEHTWRSGAECLTIVKMGKLHHTAPPWVLQEPPRL